MIRPSFASTITALTLTIPALGVQPADEDLEVAEVLAELTELHIATADEADQFGNYGTCVGCRDSWPCKAWMYGEELAVLQLGRAADRVWARSQSLLDSLAAADRRTP